ncbi:MAG: hypothetical protein M1831_005868 [Alyxoria varia]|nr:MAG: hypothetical protein M1831_005868 [Alyxoria varia]
MPDTRTKAAGARQEDPGYARRIGHQKPPTRLDPFNEDGKPYSQVPGPPRRSLLSRIFRGFYKTFLIISASMGLGAGVALMLLPNHGVLKDIFLTTPPSAAETLTAFQPDDSEASAINEELLNNPLVLEARNAKPTSESRPHLKIPESLRPTMLTTGPLSGPGGITVPPLQFDYPDHTSTFYHLGSNLCGHPGIVHGGVIATLLDEGLARCCFPKLPHRFGVTAYLNVSYSAPAPANNLYVLHAWTMSVEGRKALVTGKLFKIDSEKVGDENVPSEEWMQEVAVAEALFVTPRASKWQALIASKWTGE